MFDTSLGSALAYLSACVELVYPTAPKDPTAPPKESCPSESPNTATEPTGHLRQINYGIWTIYEEVSGWQGYIPGLSIIQSVILWWATLPSVKRFIVDLWGVGGILCFVYVAASLVSAVLPSLTLYYSSVCFRVIEKGTSSGNTLDRNALLRAAAGRLFCSFADWVATTTMNRIAQLLERRIKYFLNSRLVATHVRLDLATTRQDSVKAKLDSEAAQGDDDHIGWQVFQTMVDFVSTILEVATQASFLLHGLKNQPGGPIIAALCLLRPLVTLYLGSSYLQVYFARITNEHYLRMKSLMTFASSQKYRKEILGNGIAEYIHRAYDSSRALFGDTSDKTPWSYGQDDASHDLLMKLVEQLPLAYLLYRIMLSPGEYTITSLALLERIINEFSQALIRVKRDSSSALEAFISIRSFYGVMAIENVIQDGDISYPVPSDVPSTEAMLLEKDVTEPAMKVEFRNVSFKYPGADDMVLEDLSFTLQPGTLCVIVGENGCGKSSTISLLSRMYDVTGGDILIDDHSLKSLRVDDVRKAFAIMYQDYQHFPLDVRENIALGNPSLAHDLDAVKESARLGGALEFIEKLPNGFDSKLENTTFMLENGTPAKGGKLEAIVKEVDSLWLEVSGGQNQRLALSRTFMRSLSPGVRLLAYDEPSAALDPKAEFELFERLKDLRGRKTMIFVTHRFGHLTKHADHIIYMDKGKAVEQGNHEELLAKDGLYEYLLY